MLESEYLVYRWENETMTFERRLFIKHEVGEQLSKEDVRGAMEAEVHDFKAALYRLIPADRFVDVEVQAAVILP